MDTSELRIGNIVGYEYFNPQPYKESFEVQAVSIVGVLKDTFYFKLGNRCVKIKQLKPIPITEGWLARMGFKQDEELEYRWHLDDWLTYDFDDKCIRLLDSWDFGTREYVHQIQNLYFALTGQELKLSNHETI